MSSNLPAVVYQTPEDAPPEVHASLTALRALSREVKSLAEWRARGRQATPEEVALATLLRKPNHCASLSVRTGLPCTKLAQRGTTVCRRHGGNLERIQLKAERRLALEVVPSLRRMAQIRDQSTHLNAAQKAAADLLDRANIGAAIQAKVAAAHKDTGSSGVTVNIGFLGDVPTVNVTPK